MRYNHISCILLFVLVFNCFEILQATNYYIDNTNGNDGNDGLSPSTAWQSLDKVNLATFSAGDSVLFIRGGVWRGQLKPQSGNAVAMITYSAFGIGSKPLLLGSINAGSATEWSNIGGNIWQSIHSSSVDVGNLIFNNGTGVGFKKWSLAAVQSQGDFWWDKTGTHTVQLYSVTNPGSFYSAIELALGNFIVYAQLDSFFVLQDFDFRYGGADGVEIRNTHHAIIQDCDFSFIGGTELTTQVRYGGGIQFWAYSNNNTVQRCRFWEIYDDAVTNQCTPSNAGPAQQYNLYYRNNLIWNCSESSFCCDMRPATLTGSFMKNIYFENNTCINAGGGWAASQRPDLKGFQIYFSAITAPTDSIFIRNNIFYKSRAVLFVDNSSIQTLNYTTLDYNDWYTENETDTIVALWTSHSLNIYTKPQFTNYQSVTGEDAHSFVSDPQFVNLDNNNYHLNGSSPCIGTGINTGIGNDFDLNPRPQIGGYDIGAYQTITSGINTSSSNRSHFKIYPNPASKILEIYSIENQQCQFQLISAAGVLLKEFTVSQNTKLDISDLASGLYFVKNRNNPGQTQKFIKE